MIGWLKGKIKFQNISSLIVETVSGVGYEVEMGNPDFKNIGDDIEIWIYTNVRETEIKLYGFNSLDKKDLFEKLLNVSGVGPKIAHVIVSSLEVADIQSAILLGEPKTFTKVSGVGKKVSERIILELKDKIQSSNMSSDKSAEEDEINVPANQNVRETFDALISLGYDVNDIRSALKNEDITLSSKELIKICLKKIKH